MKASAFFNGHIFNMIRASGNKRVVYAVVNVIIMALAVFFAVCVKWSWHVFTETSFVVGLLALICSITATVYTFLQGFIAQFALVIIAGIGMARAEERGANIAAFVIALLTTVGLAAACVVLLLTL